MTLEAIKEAIAELPDREKTSLVSWLNAQDAEAWNRQIEADFSEGGAGVALLEQWDSEIAEANSISLDEFLRQRRALTRSRVLTANRQRSFLTPRLRKNSTVSYRNVGRSYRAIAPG